MTVSWNRIGFVCVAVIIGCVGAASCSSKPGVAVITRTRDDPDRVVPGSEGRLPDDPGAPMPTAPPPREVRASSTEPGGGGEAAPEKPKITSNIMREILPGVRVNMGAKIVEFDGIVPMDCHNPRTPDVYLEVTVCTPDTKEHESLVMTKAKAANVHAALLAVGLEPGAPGRWDFKDRVFTPVAPTGSPVNVTFSYRGADGKLVEVPATDWIINATTKAPFAPIAGSDRSSVGWVFAGSRMATHEGKEFYDADGVGTLVGLCTFGSETVAWRRVMSPDSDVQEPEWIADPAKVPAYGTPVTVRITPASGG